MRSSARLALNVAAAVGIAALLVIGVVLILTQTDWGREQVRRFAVERLDAAAEGEVRIGRLEGNLVRRVRLVDVSIVDGQGRPFVRADTLATAFSLRGLLRQRLIFSELRLVHGEVVLDKPPGEDWNWVRIFPTDPDPRVPDRPGWGDWIELHDATVVGSRLTIRTEWTPPEDADRREREEALRHALSDDSRENVVAVPGGYQNVMDFRELHAELPRVRPTHPDRQGVPIEVARFRGIVQPFRPPAAVVEDLSGEFRIARDSLFFTDVQAVLPGSRLAAEGVYALDKGELLLRMNGAPVAFADLRWLYPPLPEQGGGALQLHLEMGTPRTRVVAEEMDLRAGDGWLGGRLDLILGDSLRLQETDLRFRRLDTRLIQRLAPGLELPRQGELTGRAALHGQAEAMRMDADVTFADHRAGASRVVAAGELGLDDELRFTDLRLRFEPLQAQLVRAFAPQLPLRGTITGHANLTGPAAGPLRLDGDLALHDPVAGRSRVRAVGGLDTRDELRLNDLLLHFEPLRLDLLRDQLPELPAGGAVAGRLRLDGVPARGLELAADLTLTDPRTGVSRVAASGGLGGLGTAGGPRFRALQLRFDPLQLELVQAFAPELPLGGELEGGASITGSPATRVGFEAGLTHREAGERSRVFGRGEVVTGPAGRASLDLRLEPLSLATVGRFAPGAGLRGDVAGRLRAHGDLADLAIDADLRVPDGGELRADGRLDLASEQPGYRLGLALNEFDLAAVTARAPAATGLTGTASARGSGTDPATMDAVFVADLVGSAVDDIAADEVRLRLAVQAGLARVDRSLVRIGTAEAELDGSFGLVAARDGELAFRVTADSLHSFAAWVPGAETGVATPAARTPAVAPGPQGAAADPAIAADPAVERVGRVTRVRYPGAERLRAPRPRPVDTVPEPADPQPVSPVPPGEPRRVAELPPDSLAGRLRAEGALSGNIERFDLRGTAEVEDLVASGVAVGAGRASYSLIDVRSPELDLDIDAHARGIRGGGLDFDSADARVRYRGGRHGHGHAVFAAHADEDTDVRLDAEFGLTPERNELRLGQLEVRFDTAHWRTTRPALVSWGDAGIEVEALELRSDLGGRVFVDGRLPVEGAGDLDVVVDDLEIGHLVELAQADTRAAGRLSLEARVEGTPSSPRFEGDATLRSGSLGGRRVPATHASFAYRDRELEAVARMIHEGREVAVAEARLPLDLALTGDGEPRLLERPLEVDVRADSLPLDMLPALTEQVRDLRGVVVADLAVRGTFDAPVLEGTAELDVGAFHLVPIGIVFRDIAGSLRVADNQLIVDSLVARSGGPIRIAGTVALPRLTEPVFDLEVDAREAWIIDNGDARLQVDAELEVNGPLTAVEVTGEVRTRQGVIYIPELAELGSGEMVDLEDPGTFVRIDTLFAAERARLIRPSPILTNLQMDVAVRIDTDVWLRSTEANVEIYTPDEVGPLRVLMNGGPAELALVGTINTDRGDYEFMGRRFQLTRGAVSFPPDSPELNPFLQLAAQHEVRLPGREGFDIRVVLSGTIEDLQITLESNAQPPISQTDLMSYLAFGRDASSLLAVQGSGVSGQATSGGDLAGNVAGLATQQLAAVAIDELVKDLERDAARGLGLDVIRITPADLPAEVFTGSYIDVLRGTEIEVGRYVTPRVFVSGQARPTFVHPGALAEYRMPGGLIWTVTWRPRYLAGEPTLADRDPPRASVFGAFLAREWRF